MPSEYVTTSKVKNTLRLPLQGNIDLTYRCNNNCRHCWLRIPMDAPGKKDELTFTEIKNIVDAARKMGCRDWHISGGEPMLRPDFAELFDYITANCTTYSLNTNGTLITPQIAQLMKRKGAKMVAIYGATSQVHDYITRSPGSFDATMAGFRYLKESGAGFTVQIIPMKDNYHQLKEMFSLAGALSKYYRIGAPWLFLSASGNSETNKEIMRQRVAPKEVIALAEPNLSWEEAAEIECGQAYPEDKEHLFFRCATEKRDFHIDPYAQMSFCSFVKHPMLRYDLRKGTFRECWDKFIPSLAQKIKINQEYKENCGSCSLKKDCHWCPAYGYLEHKSLTTKINYLCQVAKEKKKFKDNWQRAHRRYYQIAGITLQIDADLPINENTFHPKFKQFEVNGPGDDVIRIRHYFELPDLAGRPLGKEVYHKSPWQIYKNNGSWIYLSQQRVAVFNHEHSRARIYQHTDEDFLKGNLHSLTLFPTDQILLARILADRGGFYLHSCGVNLNGKGLLFVGHSEAGKSTIATLLKGKAEILCDDRMIVRRVNGEFKIYGTWSHGDVAKISAKSVPLKAILFLHKAKQNSLEQLKDKKETIKKLLACLIKPFVTTDWWDKTLTLIEKLSEGVPSYELCFDKSGKVINLLERL